MTKEKPKFTHIRIAKTGEVITYLDQGFELFEDKDPLWKQPEEQFSHIPIQEGEPITVEVDDNMAEYIGSMLSEIKPGNLIESLRASKNAAEIFCRTTNYGYKTFNSYALDAMNYDPEDLPDKVKTLSSQLYIIFKFAGIDINHRLLAYAIYNHYNYFKDDELDVTNTVYHLIEIAIELKEEGMIQ